MENRQSFASESSKTDQPKNIPMEAETRDIYAPSTSKQGLETSPQISRSHSKTSFKRGKKSRGFPKESAKTKSNLPSSTKSKQKSLQSCSNKRSLEHKGKSPISIEKEYPDE
ncbi:hypothetical protein CEXT_666701 [Caerostris extrusa]|uniref:Uncharacterized protein n=1 Tax=Caerostris extrusa TaxID=172846 RepID=A0AAV4YED7_CAEEX|nr:hypothetical protein CEXT_666701 [Caerostris extrusa]